MAMKVTGERGEANITSVVLHYHPLQYVICALNGNESKLFNIFLTNRKEKLYPEFHTIGLPSGMGCFSRCSLYDGRFLYTISV